MPPTLIIDGYNLIRNSPTLSPIDRRDIEEGREALISRLAEYRKVRRFPITVVFDGAASYHLASTGETRMGIKILFSQRGQTADDLIVALANQKGRETVVVTSDRGIRDRLNKAECFCVSSEAFDAKIDNALYELYKGHSMEEEDGAGPPPGRRKGASRKLPKKLRRQKELLRKL